MTIPDRITFRPGPLAGALGKRLDLTGETPSEYIRRLIADELGVEAPAMLEGQPGHKPRTKKGKKK